MKGGGAAGGEHGVALRAMLEARSIAIVGASDRPGSFGRRAVEEVAKSSSGPDIHLVNPGYSRIAGRFCVASLEEVPGPVDLVLLCVPDAALEDEMKKAAGRGDRSAVVFGNAWSDGGLLRGRLASIAGDAQMALCGAGCMGFVNVAHGLRAIGYVEPDPVPAGPLALVSCSGSAFSALLRTHRRFGWTLAVSSGQELVTPAAAYLEYAIDLDGTRVVGLLLEQMREPARLSEALALAASRDIVVVALTVGRSAAGRSMVVAHSGALAGEDASWEALFEAHGVLRVHDLDEMTDTLELFGAPRRPPARPGGPVSPGGPALPGGIETQRGSAAGGIATVHDSGAERALVVDLAADLALRFAEISPATEARLAELLDPGLEPSNPLDLWGTGADTQERVRSALLAFADDPGVDAVALSVDLVFEFDGDDSYEVALMDAFRRTSLPMVLLSNLHSAIDPTAADRLRLAGIPVLEGTRTGMLALRHMLARRDASMLAPSDSHPVDRGRRERWLRRLGRGPLSGAESLDLVADYGIPVTRAVAARDRFGAVRAAEQIGLPVVLKTDVPGVAHKSDVGGVALGLGSVEDVARAYDDLAHRLGPQVLVAESAPEGVEIALGIVRDPGLGTIVVIGTGGLLVELIADRSVALAPVDARRARQMVDRLKVRPVLGGARGAAAADIDAITRAVVSMSVLATELGTGIEALDVNPLRCRPGGVIALDALVVATSR